MAIRPQCFSRFPARPASTSWRLIIALLVASVAAATASLQAQPAIQPQPKLELTRAVRPWESLDVTGSRAALFGNESGRVEAWVYPLKILRNFHLLFHAEEHVLLADSLARTVIVRPESTTILYASDTFTVRETMVVPLDRPGAVIYLDIHSAAPLEIEAVFERDFQLEWPAVLADPDIQWLPAARGYLFTCERPDFAAMIGSPSATVGDAEFTTHYGSSSESSFHLGVSKPGEDHKLIVLAASFSGTKQLDLTYKDMVAHAGEFQSEAATYYQHYLDRTVQLELPDRGLQQAYDWARINMTQALVDNPMLGKGLIAGYGASGSDRRPGFDWFFGRDAFWTSFALNAEGDFSTTRAALDFLTGFQRDDGKIPHEIPQSISVTEPLSKVPSAYASADATPLYLIAFDDYVTQSGDVEFARQKWPSLEKAYAYLRSTFDADHLARNETFGHGWVEGGPLFPAHMEFYQAGLGVEALHAWSRLLHATGHEQPAALDGEMRETRAQLDRVFWMPQQKHYAFAVDVHGAPSDAPTVLTMVPMWFGLVDEEHTQSTLDELAGPGHQADWGMRLLSSSDSRYDPGGYHYGSVWPLFTGWASVSQYRHHRPFAGYENLRANALLTFAGIPGHVTEVLSGDANQALATSTPHQTWSSAMVIEPLLLGMFDLHVDAAKRNVSLCPQLPANWHNVALRNIRVGEATINLRLEQNPGIARLHITGKDTTGINLDPTFVFSPHAHIRKVTLDHRTVAFTVDANPLDQHLHVHVPLTGQEQTLKIESEGDLRISYDSVLPPLGAASSGLRLTHESWSPDHTTWTMQLEGAPASTYEIAVSDPAQIASVEGGELVKDDHGDSLLRVLLSDHSPARAMLTLHLIGRKR
jgi:glycogen debranching enzyme